MTPPNNIWGQARRENSGRTHSITRHPGGMPADSRGLSEATPPVTNPMNHDEPGGFAGAQGLRTLQVRRHCAVFPVRGYRCAQPPANRFEPSRFDRPCHLQSPTTSSSQPDANSPRSRRDHSHWPGVERSDTPGHESQSTSPIPNGFQLLAEG